MTEKNGAVDNRGALMLLANLQQAFNTLTGTMEGVTDEVAHSVPAGVTNTIAANAAHAVTGIDGIINGLIAGGAPIMASQPTGLSAPAPQGDWGDWGRTVQVDLKALHGYANKVMAAASDNLTALSNEALSQNHTAASGNEMSAASWIGVIINNTCWHTGEIAALKGLKGLKGYPF